MKPTVHYKGAAVPYMGGALLSPVDHPNHLPGHNVSNDEEVITSKVISWDDKTGRIETRNTIYIPV